MPTGYLENNLYLLQVNISEEILKASADFNSTILMNWLAIFYKLFLLFCIAHQKLIVNEVILILINAYLSFIKLVRNVNMMHNQRENTI